MPAFGRLFRAILWTPESAACVTDVLSRANFSQPLDYGDLVRIFQTAVLHKVFCFAGFVLFAELLGNGDGRT